MATIGEQLRNARKAKNMTQDSLADALNVSRSSVANWEAGRRLPDVEMLMRLSTLLDYRFTDQDAPQTPAQAEAPASEEQAPAEAPTAEAAKPANKKKLYIAAALVCIVLLAALVIVPALQPKAQGKPYKAHDGEMYTIERFAAEAPNAAGKAYLRVNPSLEIMHGENVDYWMFSINYHEMNGVALSIDRIEQVYFAREKENVEMILTAADLKAYGLETDIPAYGDWLYTGGLPVQNTVLGVGVLLRATDANGKALSFTTYLPLSEH